MTNLKSVGPVALFAVPAGGVFRELQPQCRPQKGGPTLSVGCGWRRFDMGSRRWARESQGLRYAVVGEVNDIPGQHIFYTSCNEAQQAREDSWLYFRHNSI